MLYYLTNFESVQLLIVAGMSLAVVVAIISYSTRSFDKQRSAQGYVRAQLDNEHSEKIEQMRLQAKGTAITIRPEE